MCWWDGVACVDVVGRWWIICCFIVVWLGRYGALFSVHLVLLGSF